LIKFPILDQLLTDWFTTSFIGPIARDIAMGACVTKEQAIACSQYLDMVYSQSGTLYDYFPDAPRLGTSKPPPTPSVDGIIGSVNSTSKKNSANPGKQKSNASNENTSQVTSHPSNTSEINAIQSTTADKASKGKKKGKGKSKPDQPKLDSPKPPPEESAKRKPKYPCLICDEDHFTRDCPRRSEVSHLLKGAPGTPAVLKEPFPSQQTQMVANPDQSSSPFDSQVFMAGTIPIHISTRTKDYPSSVGKEPEIPSSAPPSSSGPLHIERPSTETPIRPPPKGVLRKSSYNPNAHAA